jgi:hypothetical protein
VTFDESTYAPTTTFLLLIPFARVGLAPETARVLNL